MKAKLKGKQQRAEFSKKYYLEYADAFSILKNSIESMNSTKDVTFSKIDKAEKGDELHWAIKAVSGKDIQKVMK